MPDYSVTPIKGKVMRLIALDSCGIPITGASSLVVVTKGFVQVQAEPQYEDGEQQRVKLANGELCVNDDDPDELTMVQLTIDLCGVCPSIENIVFSSARVLTAGGLGVTGTGAAYAEGPLTDRFSLEVWQAVTGRGACDSSGAQRYVYWAWPNVGNGRVGSMTIQNQALTTQIVAKTDAVNTQWNTLVAPTWMDSNVFEDGEHWAWNITSTAPPDIPSNCGATTLS